MSNRTSHRRQARQQRKAQARAVLMTDIPNWEWMSASELAAQIEIRQQVVK